MKKHIAIFASGTGSNAGKIIEYLKQYPVASVCLIVSNKPGAKVLDIARDNDIPTLVIDRQYFYGSENILEKFNGYSVDFVVLAGFLWLVPVYLVRAYEGKMVNIHPALLPKYGGKGMFGMNVHKAVHEAGEKETGITIHLVNEQYDEGDIVFQAKCAIEPDDTPETIAEKVHELEHRHFPEVVKKLLLKA